MIIDVSIFTDLYENLCCVYFISCAVAVLGTTRLRKNVVKCFILLVVRLLYWGRLGYTKECCEVFYFISCAVAVLGTTRLYERML